MNVKEVINKLREEIDKSYLELNELKEKEEALFEEMEKRKKQGEDIEKVKLEIYPKIHAILEQEETLRDKIRKTQRKLNSFSNVLDEESVLEGKNVDLYKTVLDSDKSYVYKICLHGTHTVIGTIQYRGEIQQLEKGCIGNIGYVIDEDYRGKGYAGEAFSLLANKLLEDGIKNVYIAVGSHNTSSIRVVEKLNGKLMKEYSDSSVLLYECNLQLIKNDKVKR